MGGDSWRWDDSSCCEDSAVANALETRGAGHKGKVDVILLRDMGLPPVILGSGKSSKCYGAVLKQGLRIAELNHLHAAVTVSTIRKLGSLFKGGVLEFVE